MKKTLLTATICSLVLSGVKVHAEDDTPCGKTVHLVQQVNSGQIQKATATATITATNTLLPNARAAYQAGQSITLLPGFVAEQGAAFTAHISDCFCDQLNSEAKGLSVTAYPNPFVESTTVQYKLSNASPVSLRILDEQGKLIDILVDNEQQEVGMHEYTYRSKSSLVMNYFFSLRTNQGIATKRITKQSN